MLQALSPDTVKDREHKEKWIIVYDDDEATKTYFRTLGFNIIVSDTPQMLDYIGSLAPAEPSIAHVPKHTPDLFPDHGIPSIGTVPAVPLLDFYLGSPPSWYNVFIGSIYKTGHYNRIIDKINAESDLIVIGLPASGKTTLLIQVAANVPSHDHKLVYQSPSADQVRLVLNRLDGQHAVIFVDDFCDDAEAFNLLLDARNVQVVGFDRDYNYDIVSHFFQGRSYELYNVTELSDKDIQEIVGRLPGGVRRSTYRGPRTAPGVKPSLFEIIESNVTKPTLKERFRAVLKRLKGHDLRLHDMLVMVSYVHSCRTPVSFDMLCAYFRNDIRNYNDVYDLLERIPAYVVPYAGLVDDKQDYFTPRSTIVAEAITDLTPTTDFRRVLQGFHEHVSTTRIARYYVFKRRAYDQRIVSKAFEDWQEGKKFYEFVFGKDPSPFMLQQGALYLSYKEVHSEAFAWIDEALRMCAFKIPSIKNSHACILFKANIDKPAEEPDVRVTLDQSMKILRECYSYDKRKRYHATTFAEQALAYREKFRDSVSMKYLGDALRWLQAEKELAPWHRWVRELYFKVERAIKYST